MLKFLSYLLTPTEQPAADSAIHDSEPKLCHQTIFIMLYVQQNITKKKKHIMKKKTGGKTWMSSSQTSTIPHFPLPSSLFMNLTATLGWTKQPITPSNHNLPQPSACAPQPIALLQSFNYFISNWLDQSKTRSPVRDQCNATSAARGVRLLMMYGYVCVCTGVMRTLKTTGRAHARLCGWELVQTCRSRLPTAALPGRHSARQLTNCRMQTAMQVWHASVPSVCPVPALEMHRTKKNICTI